MTSRLGQRAPGSGVLETFPDFPPRDDLQNTLHLYDDGHQAILRRYFGETETTIIFSEVPVRWNPSQRAGHRIPDFMIAFNVDRSKVAEQNGYSIRDQGKPPDFVLEVAPSPPATGTLQINDGITPASASPSIGGSTQPVAGATTPRWPATGCRTESTSPYESRNLNQAISTGTVTYSTSMFAGTRGSCAGLTRPQASTS
jgi:hypothetical protein